MIPKKDWRETLPYDWMLAFFVLGPLALFLCTR